MNQLLNLLRNFASLVSIYTIDIVISNQNLLPTIKRTSCWRLLGHVISTSGIEGQMLVLLTTRS